MSAKLSGQRPLVRAPRDGDGAAAHLGRKLDAKMAEPSNAQNRDSISRA